MELFKSLNLLSFKLTFLKVDKKSLAINPPLIRGKQGRSFSSLVIKN